MPEMDGYTAVTEFRRLSFDSEKYTPIIAMTAHALKGDREKCILAGMDDYISKPIDMNIFSATIERWLRGRYQVHTALKAQVSSAKQGHEDQIILDVSRIQDIFGVDQTAIGQFIQCFIDSTQDVILHLKTAIDRRDVTLAKETLHRLKGSAGNAGAMRIHYLMRHAEQAMINDNWDEVSRDYMTLLEEFNKFKSAIKVDVLV